jgi:RimJ/RimL family protein N-acetyltransferase
LIAPTLETKRLVLRGWWESDLAPLIAFYASDPASMFVGGPRRHDEVVMWLMARFGQWSLRGYGSFAMTEKGSDALIGWCGANHYIGGEELMLQWALLEPARGKGYMAEAGRAALDFLFQATGNSFLRTTIHPSNAASKSTARRLGGAPTGATRVEDGHELEIWTFVQDILA